MVAKKRDLAMFSSCMVDHHGVIGCLGRLVQTEVRCERDSVRERERNEKQSQEREMERREPENRMEEMVRERQKRAETE
jgi:hypothetical protein